MTFIQSISAWIFKATVAHESKLCTNYSFSIIQSRESETNYFAKWCISPSYLMMKSIKRPIITQGNFWQRVLYIVMLNKHGQRALFFLFVDLFCLRGRFFSIPWDFRYYSTKILQRIRIIVGDRIRTWAFCP